MICKNLTWIHPDDKIWFEEVIGCGEGIKEIITVVKYVYCLKPMGEFFISSLAALLANPGYDYTVAEPYVWVRMDANTDGTDYYDIPFLCG